MRAAAAEAWCRVLAEGSSNPLDGLAPAARYLENSGQNQQIHESAASRILSRSGQRQLSDSVGGELFRGIAHWVPPGRMATLDDAFKGLDDEDRASKELRKAAIEACLIYAWKTRTETAASLNARTTSERPIEYDSSLWPSSILNCQFDPETSVRKMFGRWVALVGHPQAIEVLQSQLLDKEVKVRESTLFNLGVLRTQKAREILRNQSRRSEERIRTEAVRGLAHWGALEIHPFLQDDSFHVRQAVAEELAHHADAKAAVLVRDLLIDSNNPVQAAAVHAIRDWPDELALPLLLHGLRESSSATRFKCFTQFRKRTNLQAQFPLNAPYHQRTEATVQLAKQLNLSSSHLDKLFRKGFRETRQQVSKLQIAEIKSQLNDLVVHPPSSSAYSSALTRLMRLSKRELPVIEQILLEMPPPRPKIIDSELLPSLSPVYSALYEIESPDVQVRRRGTQKLAYQGEKASLSRLATQQLKSALTHEQDRLVWRYAMLAVSRDATQESDQIALLALNHRSPDIRILGCRYIARHPKPQYAVWLLNLNLFNDSNKEVKLAAVEAAGLCRNPIVLDGLEKPVSVLGVEQQAISGPLGGLRSLLSDPDQRVRFAATIGLSHLGDPQGTQELIRMSYEPDPTIRQQVIEQMGQTGRTLFVEHLIRLAWTESNQSVKRAILSSLNQLIPEENRPVGLADLSGFDAKIRLWVDWERRQRQQHHPQTRSDAIVRKK
jgi:HEAT repeat protein